MCTEDPKLLRNVENYEEDVKNIGTSENSGILERCVFNILPDFHIVINKVVDIMHDIFEGVARYTLQKIITALIEIYKLFTVEELKVLIIAMKKINLDLLLRRDLRKAILTK